MEPVRIGCVQYLNTLPLIEGLRSWRDAEIITAVPSKLHGMLMRSEVDVALVSVIDAARVEPATQAAATLLPVGMIGCNGPTLTVRLFSSAPIETIDTVYVDTDSHTSVALLKVIMLKLFAKHVQTIDFDARERMALGTSAATSAGNHEWPPAVLLIGDKVVTDAPPQTRYPHQLDLGAAWKQLTGLPFVYAMWMCRAGEEDRPAVRAASMMLDRQRRHNQTRMDWLVATHAAERHWPHEAATQYLGTYLKYDVDEPEMEAVDKFLRWAQECGAIAP